MPAPNQQPVIFPDTLARPALPVADHQSFAGGTVPEEKKQLDWFPSFPDRALRTFLAAAACQSFALAPRPLGAPPPTPQPPSVVYPYAIQRPALHGSQHLAATEIPPVPRPDLVKLPWIDFPDFVTRPYLGAPSQLAVTELEPVWPIPVTPGPPPTKPTLVCIAPYVLSQVSPPGSPPQFADVLIPGALTDVPLTGSLGSFAATSGGDLAGATPTQALRSRIMRLILNPPNAYVHLQDFGAAGKKSALGRPSDLRMREIQTQKLLLEDPDIRLARVTITSAPNGVRRAFLVDVYIEDRFGRQDRFLV